MDSFHVISSSSLLEAPGTAVVLGLKKGPAYQTFWLLRVGFFLTPVLFATDKYFCWRTYWPKNVWMGRPHFLSVSPRHFVYGVGAVEIMAGFMVLLLPRFGPYVFVAWLGGIITNLIIISAAAGHTTVYRDIALRDFGLLTPALALGRLAAMSGSASRSTDQGWK